MTQDKPLILVTGGAGYIGSHLVRKLLQRGYTVRNLDNLAFGDASVAELLGNPCYQHLPGDIRHIEAVVQATRGAYGVIHLAGVVGDPACDVDIDATQSINLEATKLIVECCKYTKVERFVFASTCSVYGAAGDYELNEGSLLNPVSLYAETNLHSERIVLRGFEHTSIVPTIVRFATVFGASYRMRFDLVVNIMTAKAVKERKIKVFGGDQWRPNVHCQDAADGLIACLEGAEEKVRNEIFNIGSDDQNYRVRELAALIAELIPGTQIEAAGEGADQRSYRVSFAKAKHVLGFRPAFTVADGVGEIHRMLENGVVQNYLADRYYNIRYVYR
jgi:nucleoside-diphosphate-sugar epimerase